MSVWKTYRNGGSAGEASDGGGGEEVGVCDACF
jgi:hypothetical protein